MDSPGGRRRRRNDRVPSRRALVVKRALGPRRTRSAAPVVGAARSAFCPGHPGRDGHRVGDLLGRRASGRRLAARAPENDAGAGAREISLGHRSRDRTARFPRRAQARGGLRRDRRDLRVPYRPRRSRADRGRICRVRARNSRRDDRPDRRRRRGSRAGGDRSEPQRTRRRRLLCAGSKARRWQRLAANLDRYTRAGDVDAALSLLASTGDANHRPAMARLLQHSSPEIRAVAAAQLDALDRHLNTAAGREAAPCPTDHRGR